MKIKKYFEIEKIINEKKAIKIGKIDKFSRVSKFFQNQFPNDNDECIKH